MCAEPDRRVETPDKVRRQVPSHAGGRLVRVTP